MQCSPPLFTPLAQSDRRDTIRDKISGSPHQIVPERHNAEVKVSKTELLYYAVFFPNAAYSLVFNGWYMYNKNIKSHNKLLHSLQPLTTVDTCYPQAQAAVAGTSPTPGGSSRLHLNCCWMTCVVDVLKKNHYQVWFADDTTLLTVTWMANKRYGLCPAVCFF